MKDTYDAVERKRYMLKQRLKNSLIRDALYSAEYIFEEIFYK